MGQAVAPTHASLHEFVDGNWRGRLVSGPALDEVHQWLARLEAKTPLPGGASGKPLAWLALLVADADGNLLAQRCVGLLTDVSRGLDRFIEAAELDALRALFARDGAAFDGPPPRADSRGTARV